MIYRLSLFVALGTSVMLLGCPSEGDEYRDLTEKDDVVNTTPAHAHHHDEGPNGGHILEFGAHHGELVMNDDRSVAVYVLNDAADAAKPVENATLVLHLKVDDKTVDVPLTAAPQEGEAEGMSSKFVAEATAIPESIKDIEGITGSIDLKIGEETSTAKIAHDHDDHGHDH